MKFKKNEICLFLQETTLREVLNSSQLTAIEEISDFSDKVANPNDYTT